MEPLAAVPSDGGWIPARDDGPASRGPTSNSGWIPTRADCRIFWREGRAEAAAATGARQGEGEAAGENETKRMGKKGSGDGDKAMCGLFFLEIGSLPPHLLTTIRSLHLHAARISKCNAALVHTLAAR